ncbi:MAG TPA: 4-(cytidine 5'-diphospho)-2-C-methyl-D-erythritol kinase [Chitinophagaceae bacterium]|nr:4-(cytidine 5'-diphospho)-2-C-methyl-D-erythritol kinase [Chitinophagaceae bacterium]
MICFPNCKINLGLNVVRKRTDGFHDLETVFYPLPIYDVLEIIPAHSAEGNDITFTATGIPTETNDENNLCAKAYHLLKKEFPQLPPVEMHLHKTIPIGAGLGGGSADASFTLKLLGKLFDIAPGDRKLMELSLSLGSDCPFFMINKPCFATNRGEILNLLTIDLGLYKLLLVNPGIHIRTAYAFSQITPSIPEESIKEILQLPIALWKGRLRNDFEEPLFKQYPEIGKIKDELYGAGALYASMSGSGSSVYGIFEKEKDVYLSFPPHYFTCEVNL